MNTTIFYTTKKFRKYEYLLKKVSWNFKFVRATPNSTYNLFDPNGIKNVIRLRLGLSFFTNQKICSCTLDI